MNESDMKEGWREATTEECKRFYVVSNVSLGGNNQVALLPTAVSDGVHRSFQSLRMAEFAFGREYLFYFGGKVVAGKPADDGTVLIRPSEFASN